MPRDTASSAFVSSTCGVEDKPTGSTLDHSVFGPLYMGSRVLNRSLQTFLSHSLSLCKYIFYITRLSPLYDLQGFRQYISLQPDSIICNSRSLEAVWLRSSNLCGSCRVHVCQNGIKVDQYGTLGTSSLNFVEKLYKYVQQCISGVSASTEPFILN